MACCDDLPHGLATGWMEKKRTKGCAKQRVEDFATRIPKSWQQIRPAQALWGPKRRAFPIGRSVKRPDANFLALSPQKDGKEGRNKSTPPPSVQQSFSCPAASPFPSPTKYTTDHRQYAYLQDIGANPSAEDGGDEGTDDTASTALDVVHSFRLAETSFDKKSYMGYLKQYIKKVKEHMKSRDASEDEIKEFETGVKSYVSSDTFKKFKYDFYTGESMDADGMVVLLNYRDDETTPYCVFWKHGLSEMKV
ncbi:hypothetical protein D6D01_02741 [Aureobasidium pullulans]|uniref:Translationally-controlled tumor protein homolog n=1 Tax=Aureobasidium pullulans TaxID=5580 RepID=A0A4S9LQW0_AURPU|nr:hypothetical protein D6D01_02741 [Aureobasidium pullulans]